MADDISKNKPKLVVAIDFGTSGSGFTFQLRSHYETSKTSHIYENADWGHGVRRSKTSTCLLIRPDFQNKKNTTAYFGETAEIEYNNFKEDDLEEWYFFRNFKMQLYDKQTIYSDLMIRGDKGKELPAYYVFGESIRCIKEKALEYIGQWNDAYLNETIKWVITVPAIWSEGAKQIMRKAAEEADIPPELTSIALEPEAVGIYSVEMEEELAGACKEGEPYFIVDMGGGTVDITTLRSLGGKNNQLQPADGCDSGGEAVNKKMFELMSNMFGKKLWTEFADERSFYFVEFRKSVEKAKCSIKTNKSNPKTDFFNLHLPVALLTDFAKEKGCSMKDAIKLSSKGRMEIEMGGLKVQADVLREIMDETVQKVKSHINKEIDELQKKGHDVCSVILVGGFSSSDFVFQKIKEYIQTQKPRIHVRRPPYSQIAVMNGAVLYGQDESILASRSLMMTFGIRATRLYTKDFPVEKKGRDKWR